MSNSALQTAREQAAKLRHRLALVREESQETISEGLGAVTQVASGVAFGAAEEKWGQDAIMGASIPLVVGLPAVALAIAGYGGSMRSTMLHIGTAGLTIEGYKWGASMTRDWLASDEAESETP